MQKYPAVGENSKWYIGCFDVFSKYYSALQPIFILDVSKHHLIFILFKRCPTFNSSISGHVSYVLIRDECVLVIIIKRLEREF